MFHPEDLQAVDVREYARRQQQRFFRSGQYDPHEVASMIALEAMLSGAEDVQIQLASGWICIYSDVDWLGDSETDAFEGFVPFAAGGPNGVTSEFFPVVFSRSVATAARGEARSIKGDSLGPLASLGGQWNRAVAFEVAGAENE